MSSELTQPYIILKKADRLIKNEDPFLIGEAIQGLNSQHQERVEEHCSPEWNPQWKSDLDTELRKQIDGWKTNGKKSQSDIEFAILIHRIFFDLPRRIAALDGFWHELTFTSEVCEEYVRWRWGSEKTIATEETLSDPELLEDSAINLESNNVSTTGGEAINNTVKEYQVQKVRFTGDIKRNALSRLWWAAEATCQRTQAEPARYDYTRRGLANSDVMQYIVDVESFAFAQATNNNRDDIRLWKHLIEVFEAKRDKDGKEDSAGQYKLLGNKGFVSVASELGRVLMTVELSILDDTELAELVKETAEIAIKRKLEENQTIKKILTKITP